MSSAPTDPSVPADGMPSAPVDPSAIAPLLLGWYDRHHRSMPWRVPPAARAEGVRPDAYRVWLSEVMLQQTTVAAVRGYFERFIARWPTVQDLAAAEDAEVMAEWAGLGYYARARNLLKCARAVAERGGFPTDRDSLLTLPGIGPYTAAAVAAIVHDEPVAVVDGNVERVTARLFAVEEPLPMVKPWLAALAVTLTPERRAGDFAQAMMDLGATVCTPRRPACTVCPLVAPCAGRAAGLAAELPRRLPKAGKPLRRGFAYVALDPEGGVLLETRPGSGLLGGMLGFPGSDWSADPQPAPPLRAEWRRAETLVRHTFTHFQLELTVLVAAAPAGSNPERGAFLARNRFDPEALPTVMRKVWAAAAA